MKYFTRLFLGISFCLLFTQARPTEDSLSNYPDSLNKKRLAAVIIGESSFYLSGMSYLQYIWYKDHDRVPFHLYDDSKGYLQIDKCGHAFGAYLESYLGYEWLRQSGVSRKKALLFGAPLGAVLQFPIEVFDGIYEGWGFSVSDVAANTAGASLVAVNELLFREQLIKYKFSYQPSVYAQMGNGYLGDNWLESLFYDYNGHTYWLSLPIKSIVLIQRLPKWLCLSAGYSANGMYGEFTNQSVYGGYPLPNVKRTRQFLLSLDIDLTQIETKSKFVNTLFDQLFWIKFPMPALEWNTNYGLKAHSLYW
jgi:VanZ family protein